MLTPLWRRLESFAIGAPGAALSFAERLARENGWALSRAERTVAEYRRFLYLCIEAGHPVTPSDAVDQAWHLHLTYTESYWDDLCRDLLGRPLHHGPTRGGPAEDAKYRDWYERTLMSYEHHFGMPPPADLWPPPEVRFGAARFRRVDTSHHWLVPKPGRGAFQAALLSLASLALLGCTAVWQEISGFDIFVFLFFLVAVLIVVGAIVRYRGGGSGGGKHGNGAGGGGCGGGSSCGGGCGNSGDSGSSCGSGGCGGGGD